MSEAAASMSSGPTPVAALDWPGIVKEAAIAAAIGAALFFPMVALKTDIDESIRLVVQTRWADFVTAVLWVFLGRLGLAFMRERAPQLSLLVGGSLIVIGVLAWLVDGVLPSEFLKVLFAGTGVLLVVRAGVKLANALRGARELSADEAGDLLGRRLQRIALYATPFLLIFAVTMPFLPGVDRRILDIGILIVTYIMLGWGLNIIVGLAGLLDLGYVAFYAVGAYSYALLAIHFDLSFWVCLPLAGLFAASFGLLLGFPVLRLRGDYFAITTLGFGEIVRLVLINWYSVTNGPDGLSSIPRPDFFGIAEFSRGEDGFAALFGLEYSPIHRIIFLYYLILMMALVTNFFTMRIRRLPIGRAWEALREDEIASQSLGINRTNTKLNAFAFSAMFGGFAGSFFATRQGFISPESFVFLESAIILAIVVLGGMGSQLGVVLATLVVIGLPEVFRELEDYRMTAFGLGMVFIMVWRPRGLLAHREPTLRLHSKSHVADPDTVEASAAPGAGGGR